MHKIKVAAVLMAAVLPAYLYSQSIDTISFVPVKHGYYENISTKSLAHLSSATGTATMESLNVHSNTLNIETAQVNFGKDVYIGGNAAILGIPIIDSSSNLNTVKVTSLNLGGNAVVGDSVVTGQGGTTTIGTVSLQGVRRISALNIDANTSSLSLPVGKPLIVDGVSLVEPDCGVDGSGKNGAQWIETQGWLQGSGTEKFYKFLAYGCTGYGGVRCEVSERDRRACDRGKPGEWNTWVDSECCCSGNKVSNFFDGAEMCQDKNTTAMCSGGKLTNLALACNKYNAGSPQCVCGKQKDKKACIRAIYGYSSPEASCTYGSTKWPCRCPDLQWLLNPENDTRHYACVFQNTPAKRCPLECNFPMIKEQEWGGDWNCICMDPVLFGQHYGGGGRPNPGGGGPKCSSDWPYSYNFKGCCCGEFYNSGGWGQEPGPVRFVAASTMSISYAWRYHNAAQNDSPLPEPDRCPNYFNATDLVYPSNSYGMPSSFYASAYPCNCSSSGY